MYNSFISSIRRFKFGANSQLLAGFIVMILLLLVMAGIALVTFDTYQKDLQTTRKLDTFAENAQNLQTSLRAEALDFATLLIRQEANLDKNFLDRNTYIGQSLIPSLTQ